MISSSGLVLSLISALPSLTEASPTSWYSRSARTSAAKSLVTSAPLVSVFGEANTAPSCHGVSSPTQPKNLPPPVSISVRAPAAGRSSGLAVQGRGGIRQRLQRQHLYVSELDPVFVGKQTQRIMEAGTDLRNCNAPAGKIL